MESSLNNDESIISNSKVAQSFTSLIKKYNHKTSLQSNTIPPVFHKEYFCNEECYHKFLAVLNKIKNNQISPESIVLPQDSSNDHNILSKALTYYYQVGYWMKSQENL